jgi:hypothetical protein
MTGFEQWMEAVDRVLLRKVGFTSSDLPDVLYRDWYDDGVTAAEAADMAIEQAF